MSVYKLITPIERVNPKEGEEKVVTEVTMRRMTAGDMLVTDKHKGDVAKALALVSQLTGIDMATLGRLDATDFEALSDQLGGPSKKEDATA